MVTSGRGGRTECTRRHNVGRLQVLPRVPGNPSVVVNVHDTADMSKSTYTYTSVLYYGITCARRAGCARAANHIRFREQP
jgi:hypothetical protein